ncbi:MAG TPA: sterol desaturase family protein [Thermoanaerobaculia bacterium]|nr:sterol desaturase family protein [Thermoanaerobaculia bacterium]
MRRNALYILLYACGVYGLVLWPPVTAAVTAIAAPLRNLIAEDVARIPLAVRCVLALIAFDLLAYWVHRAAHASALLWRIHRVHHSDPDLGPWTTFRFHVVEIAWRMAVQFLPLYLLGVVAAIPNGVYLALLVFNLVAHSDLDWRFGPLVGPAYHGVHHRDGRANFGMFFVAWDVLFRTAR